MCAWSEYLLPVRKKEHTAFSYCTVCMLQEGLPQILVQRRLFRQFCYQKLLSYKKKGSVISIHSFWAKEVKFEKSSVDVVNL